MVAADDGRVVRVRVGRLGHHQSRHPGEDGAGGGGQGSDVDRVGVGAEPLPQAGLEGVDLGVGELAQEVTRCRRGLGGAFQREDLL